MQLGDENPTYYDVLELASAATPQEIRSAYLRLKNAYSKDSLALYSLIPAGETEDLVKRIEEAYLILSHPEKRRAYDASHGFIQEPVSSVTPLPGLGMQIQRATHNVTPARVTTTSESTQAIEEEILKETEFTGVFLRRVREARGISVDELSDFTRITKMYVIAIEDEDYARLPASVYLRGFLIQIAKRLKLPQEPLVNAFIHRFKQARPDK